MELDIGWPNSGNLEPLTPVCSHKAVWNKGKNGPVCFVLRDSSGATWTWFQWGSSTARYCSVGLGFQHDLYWQRLKEIFNYLAWGILGLTSEACSWLPWFQSTWTSSEPARLKLFPAHRKQNSLEVHDAIFFFFKKQGSLLKQARTISLAHTPLASPPSVLQLLGPGNFWSSQRKLLHPPVNMKKTITRPGHLCTQCNSLYTLLLKEFIVMKFFKIS